MEGTFTIARWETRGGRFWIELLRVGDGVYEYAEDGGGGGWFHCKNDSEAIACMLPRIENAKKIDGINLIRKI